MSILKEILMIIWATLLINWSQIMIPTLGVVVLETPHQLTDRQTRRINSSVKSCQRRNLSSHSGTAACCTVCLLVGTWTYVGHMCVLCTLPNVVSMLLVIPRYSNIFDRFIQILGFRRALLRIRYYLDIYGTTVMHFENWDWISLHVDMQTKLI